MSSVIRDTERSPGAVAALEWPCRINLMCMHMRVHSRLCARVRKMRKIVVRVSAVHGRTVLDRSSRDARAGVPLAWLFALTNSGYAFLTLAQSRSRTDLCSTLLGAVQT